MSSSPVLLLALIGGASGTEHWSDVNWAKCEGGSGIKWDLSTHDGGDYMSVIDRESGRCLAVKDCEYTAGGDAYGRLILEPCTTSNACQGKNQRWRFRNQHASPMLITTTPPAEPTAIECGAKGFPDGPGADGGQGSWCICDVFSPDRVGGTLVNVAGYCGASNSQFVFHTEDDTIRLKDPQHSGLGQCLHGKPCDSSSTPPCSLPASWGDTFLILFCVAGALYAGGGVAFGVRSGEPAGLTAHPHHAAIKAVAGLAQDGVAFTRARIAERRGGGGARGAALLDDSDRGGQSPGKSSKRKKEKKERREKQPAAADESPAEAPSAAASSAAAGTSAGDGGRWVKVPEN